MKFKTVVWIAAPACALAACATQVSGEPSSPASPSTAGSTSTSPDDHTLDLRGFDACTAITPQLAAELGVDEGPQPLGGANNPACLWAHIASEPIENYFVDSSDSRDISVFPGRSPHFKVGRYDAVIDSSPESEFEKSCQVLIGIKANQVLQVAYSYDGSALTMTHDLACKKAIPTAEMVIASLEERGGR